MWLSLSALTKWMCMNHFDPLPPHPNPRPHTPALLASLTFSLSTRRNLASQLTFKMFQFWHSIKFYFHCRSGKTQTSHNKENVRQFHPTPPLPWWHNCRDKCYLSFLVVFNRSHDCSHRLLPIKNLYITVDSHKKLKSICSITVLPTVTFFFFPDYFFYFQP